MSKVKRTFADIPLERIFLHHENPRHEPYATQSQVIEYLCRDEEVAQLARDIAQNGLSPFDRFGVTLDDPTDEHSPYVMAEGNRRLCALKLLTDPELAPPERKAFFEKQSQLWTPITEVPCCIFDDETDLDLWLKRRHHGPAGGLGQKPWNADQKARHSGKGSRNRVALSFLDYAEQEKLISAEERKGKLTTAQRYLGNPVFREALGIDITDPDEVLRNRTQADFKLLAKRFVEDMTGSSPKAHSRNDSDKITAYARELTSLGGQSHVRVEPEPLVPPEEIKAKSIRRPKPGKAKRPQRLPYDQNINRGLKELGVWKTESLYRSVCDVSLPENTPLLAVGVWSFFESLTARMGRQSDVSFVSFLSASKLQGYGLGDKRQTKPLRDALERILHFGNTTKHHDTSALFNGDQLANDLETLSELIQKCIEDALANPR